MVLRLGSRDRSGRVPRASSRTGAFYQSLDDWSVPGAVEAPPILQATPSAETPSEDDFMRGAGY